MQQSIATLVHLALLPRNLDFKAQNRNISRPLSLNAFASDESFRLLYKSYVADIESENEDFMSGGCDTAHSMADRRMDISSLDVKCLYCSACLS